FSRSSMTLHSFQGTLLSLQRAESVTHLSGMNCHPSLGKGSSGHPRRVAACIAKWNHFAHISPPADLICLATPQP
ncbi:hypothetical protein EN933_22380, partial [Mesorhizobium sp. M7A.F.Ca.US.001.01.1.1]